MRNDASVPTSCPVCLETTGRLLVILSAIAHADYYQCERCAHVWHAPRASDGVLKAAGVLVEDPGPVQLRSAL